MILVTVTGVGIEGIDQWRWSTGTGFVDQEGRVYEPRLIDAGNFERFLVNENSTFGRSRSGAGDVIVNNADGALDSLLDVTFDGQEILIQTDSGALVLRGTIGGIEITTQRVVFRIRDRQAEVTERMLVDNTYRGDNALPDGLEGVADSIKGQTKPQPYGKVRAVSLPMVNTSRVILQVANRVTQNITIDQIIAVDQIQDGGAVITASTPYASIAAMEASAPSSGQWRAFLGSPTEGAYVRLGSTPQRALTADITEGATNSDRTAAQIMRRMLMGAGIPPTEIIGAEAVDSVAGWTAGFWAEPGSGVRLRDALDALASSVHGYWIGQKDGSIRLGVIRAPSGSPKLVIESWAILKEGSSFRRVVGEGQGLPAWKITVEYQRVWTVQTKNELAGVALPEQERLGQEYRKTSPREDTSIRDRHALAREIVVPTLLDNEADAVALRDALWTMYSVQRDVFLVSLSQDIAADIDLDDVVELRLPRFGLAEGKLFRVIGIVETLRNNRVELTLWG